MPDLPPWTARPLAVVLAPLLLSQGLSVRRSTPVLPEAAGRRVGAEGSGSHPPVRLLVLGESTAAGVGVAHQREGLAAQLATALVAAGAPRVDWRVVARAGMTAHRARRELVPRATVGAVARDGFHPGADGYRRWARDLAEAARTPPTS